LAFVKHSSVFKFPREKLFHFLFREDAWERGLPPDFYSELQESGPFREKTQIKLRLTRLGFSANWAVKIDKIVSNEQVILTQVVGPFEEWVLTQTFEDHGESTTRLTDHLEYRLPLGVLGCLVDDLYMKREWARLLDRRHEKIYQLLSQKFKPEPLLTDS
jgi:ligand-binding SRPBCC domain-containing protein